MLPRFSATSETTTAATLPWWLVMIVGITVFIVGLLMLTSPGMTLIILVQLLGVYFLTTGILSLASIGIDRNLWAWKLISGILGVFAGLVVLRDPLWSAILVPKVLVIILAVEALIMGIAQGIHAFSGGGLGLGLLSILNIVFGLILLFNPLIGALALPIILGILAVIGGSLTSILAFVARPRMVPTHPSGTQPV